MHVENFKVFCDLVENKSFSRAAKINSITQSAVSQQLRSIEEQLQSVVVDRSQKQFRLTPEGEVLYSAAKDIFRRFEQLNSDILGSKNIVSGRLHISTIYSVGLHELDPYIKRFLKEYPAVNIRLEYRTSGAVYEDVTQGISDVGIVAFPQKSRYIDVVDFTEDRLVAICAPGHPLAKEKSIQLKDLADHRFIGFSHETPSRKAIDNFFRDAKVDIETAIEFDNIETMKRAVEIDTGVAIVPSTTVLQEVKLGTLIAPEIKGKPLVRPIGILYRKGRILTPAMKYFIQTLTGKSA